ncbi:hypothetical protein CTI12_AA553620 [Artemisia annua]|uniref:Uncharacterized protein n=1 Tax=Artemisia annua TaxID=35608 RepID=A0A2U1KXI1_ARTAN|nr:hypothetical protein CTI12_AA553620 [Artemisia annua]
MVKIRVLSNLKSGAIESNLKFAIGSNSVADSSHKSVDSYVKTNGNYGFFIKLPLDKRPLDSNLRDHVAKSSGLETGPVNSSMGDVGSSKWNEHTSMEDVVSTGVVLSKGLDGIACDKVGSGFEFGRNDMSKGILNKPSGPMFIVQFGKNDLNNPFVKMPMSHLGSVWKTSGFNGIGKPVLSNQYTADVDRFAEKLKQGSEEMALKMEYSPNVVSKGDMNVPIVLNIWETGIWLDKTEPTSIPIWVCIYNIPSELCNGNVIGKIMSGVGRPMLMDKMTKDRCLKKAGVLDFARVLVEVSANEGLPNVLEIEYPSLGNRPAKIGKLEVKYQWKPPLCTHCGTFGHSTLACSVRPKTVEVDVAKPAKVSDGISGDTQMKESKVGVDRDGFVTVGKNNKHIGVSSKADSNVQHRHMQNGNKQGFFLNNTYYKQSGGADGNGRSNFLGQSNGVNQGKKPANSKSTAERDPNFMPKILVRGSGAKGTSGEVSNESIPISNAYQVLDDLDMEQCNEVKDVNTQEEFYSKVWPALKEEVDVLMEAGIYPSKAVRLEWSIHQMDYFYKNCHQFQLDPSYEDDDVESDFEGIANGMKPEYEVVAAGDE